MDEFRIAAPSGAKLTLSQLGIVPRILLATDGTLTHILEAYADESVYLVKLSHSFLTEPEARAPFDLVDGERALRRVIVLRGTESECTFIHAVSVVMLDRLPDGMADDLLNTERPIGKLIAEHRTETYREIIGMWEECNGPIAAHFGMHPFDLLLSRTYRIMGGGRSLAWITESFPEMFQVTHSRERARHMEQPPDEKAESGPEPLAGRTGRVR